MELIGGVMEKALEIIRALVGGSYGVAIILLTIAIRVCLLPFTLAQTRSSVRMQELQPEINKLQKQYKSEPERLNQETMALWKRYGVNPFSSCLLLLVQFPFIIAFFRVLQAYEPLQTATFLWLDLGKADPYYILPVLAAVSTYFQVKVSGTPGAGGGQQQMMLIAFPLMIGWMSLKFAAALSLYWVVSNVCSVFERFLVPKTKVAKGESTGR